MAAIADIPKETVQSEALYSKVAPEYDTVFERAILAEGHLAEVVREHFRGINHGGVERFEAPNMRVLNFLLEDSLGGGGSASLKTDAQGKTHGLALLRMELDVPDDVLASVEG